MLAKVGFSEIGKTPSRGPGVIGRRPWPTFSTGPRLLYPLHATQSGIVHGAAEMLALSVCVCVWWGETQTQALNPREREIRGGGRQTERPCLVPSASPVSGLGQNCCCAPASQDPERAKPKPASRASHPLRPSACQKTTRSSLCCRGRVLQVLLTCSYFCPLHLRC